MKEAQNNALFAETCLSARTLSPKLYWNKKDFEKVARMFVITPKFNLDTLYDFFRSQAAKSPIEKSRITDDFFTELTAVPLLDQELTIGEIRKRVLSFRIRVPAAPALLQRTF